jgi:hypothetical protein
MSKPMLGAAVGAGLGLLDGLSAAFSPEARPILLTIVAGSTLKGVLTGLAAGLVARRSASMTAGILAGVAVGFVLSGLAAIGQGDHYLEIILPGMLLGAIVGFVTQRYPQRTGAVRSIALVLALFPTAPAMAQPATITDPLEPVAVLLGKWAGTSEGQPGNGTVEREYERALGTRFIRVRNRSTYPPQEKNPKGEKHEDEGFFSFDRARKRVVLRQFHVEGFVNTYAQDLDARPGTVAFTTEGIENIPAGFRARETYLLHGPDEFEEVFELAEPGQPFAVYSRTRLKRVK